MPIWDSANLDAPHTQRELSMMEKPRDVVGELLAVAHMMQSKTCVQYRAAVEIGRLRAKLARMKQERGYEC